jgi:hypothetical protein
MDFDWVTARAQCSLSAAFERLKLEIESDVKIRNERRGEDRHYSFSVVASGDSISVFVAGNNIRRRAVRFSLTVDAISVASEDAVVSFQATLTLNNERNCRFRIKGQEYESWQLRRMALEELFFFAAQE